MRRVFFFYRERQKQLNEDVFNTCRIPRNTEINEENCEEPYKGYFEL